MFKLNNNNINLRPKNYKKKKKKIQEMSLQYP